jgi:riboflavin kinase/FMN adenylyltransferase
MPPGAGKNGTVITVGTFDGVHLGHQRVLEEIAERARVAGRRSVLVTFEPHPLEIVNPQAAPPRLTVGAERHEILAQSELDAVAFIEFDRALSKCSPEEFVRLLVDRFNVKELVIGYDHGFGKGRAGNVDLLRVLGGKMGFAVDVVAEVDYDSRPVSSTRVRREVAGGDLDSAKQLLGRHYSMIAQVIPGAGRGRHLGYRTINLRVESQQKLLPPNGVYAVYVEWAGGSSAGMMHQGPRPTFGEAERSLEVHLLDASEELYGQEVKVSWVQRLRDVTKFDSPEELVRQLEKDYLAARSALTGPNGFGNH